MDTTLLIGLLASTGTGIALLPQLIKLLREKQAQDISWLMMLSLLLGNSAWVVYGFRIDDAVVVVSNLFSLLVNCVLTAFHLWYRKRQAHGKATPGT